MLSRSALITVGVSVAVTIGMVAAGSCSYSEIQYYTTCTQETSKSGCEAETDSYCVWCANVSGTSTDSCLVELSAPCTYGSANVGYGCPTPAPTVPPTPAPTSQPSISPVPTNTFAPTGLPSISPKPTTPAPTGCPAETSLITSSSKCTNKNGKSESKCTGASPSVGSCEYCDDSDLDDGESYSSTCALLLGSPCTYSGTTYGEGCSSLVYPDLAPTAAPEDDDGSSDGVDPVIIGAAAAGAVVLIGGGLMAWAYSAGRICKKQQAAKKKQEMTKDPHVNMA